MLPKLECGKKPSVPKTSNVLVWPCIHAFYRGKVKSPNYLKLLFSFFSLQPSIHFSTILFYLYPLNMVTRRVCASFPSYIETSAAPSSVVEACVVLLCIPPFFPRQVSHEPLNLQGWNTRGVQFFPVIIRRVEQTLCLLSPILIIFLCRWR